MFLEAPDGLAEWANLTASSGCRTGTSCSGFNRLGRYGTSLEHAFGVQHGKQAEVEAFLEEVGAIVSLV